MLELETSGGRNVWGHDQTPVPDTELPYHKGGDVTERNYTAYREARDRIGMQGVGPMQLTWHTYQNEADALGGCWRPEINCRVGFRILKNYVSLYGVRDALSRYNTGGPGETAYSRKGMPLVARWEQIIGGVQ